MPRISAIEINQLNREFDAFDQVKKQLSDMQRRLNNVAQTTAISDPIHAPATTNNLTFTWTGGSGTLSWNAGWLKDKNWRAQTTGSPSVSAAPGIQHIHTIPAGSAVLNVSSYYWLAWDPVHQQMRITQDASSLHGNFDVHNVCQVFTGTAGQSGTAGGGGSSGNSDLSGARYKLF